MSMIELVEDGVSIAELAREYMSEHFYDQTVISKGIIESLQAAQDRMNELVSMTKEDIERVAAEFNESLVEDTGLSAVTDSHIDELLGQMPATHEVSDCSDDDVMSEVEYYLSCFHNTLNIMKPSNQYVNIIDKRTPAQWYSEAVQAASDNLQRQIKIFQEENERVRITNEAVAIIKQLFGMDY